MKSKLLTWRCYRAAVPALSLLAPALSMGQSIELIADWSTNRPNFYAISADGFTVAGVVYNSSETSGVAVRWTHASGIESLGWLNSGDNVSVSNGLSADGSVIVGSSYRDEYPYPSDSFRWTRQTGMWRLGHLPGSSRGGATDVSDDGRVVCGSDTLPSTQHKMGYLWTAEEGFVALGDLPGGEMSSQAQAISGDGSTVVGLSDMGEIVPHAFRWTRETGIQALPELSAGFFPHNAFDVNYDGSVVVGNAVLNSRWHAIRWTADGGTEDLGILPGFQSSWATAVSSSGDVIAVNMRQAGGNGGGSYLWSESEGFQPVEQVLIDCGVDLTGWRDLGISDLSADGKTILGVGYYHDTSATFVAHTVPEPALFLPFAAAIGALVLRKRK